MRVSALDARPLLDECGCGWSCLCTAASTMSLRGAAAIESVLSDNERGYGFIREQEDTESLFRAYALMQPRSHTELALVVWAGHSNNPWRETMLEEYCRRRDGQESQISVHPVLHQECMLSVVDTLGLPIFREHLDLIMRVVFEMRALDLYKAGEQPLVLAEARKSRNPALQKLTDEEIVQCLELILECYGASLSYYWCCGVLEQAKQRILCQRTPSERSA